MKRVLIILLPLIFFSCDSNTGKKPPEWIHSINKSDQIIQSIGIAENKNESILNALIGLSNQIETQIQSNGNDNQMLSEIAFGKVKIKGSTKSVVEEVGVGDSAVISQYFSSVGELTFSDGNKWLIYKNSTEESTGKESSINHSFEIIETNCALKDLIEELNSIGCNFEFYSDDNRHYTLIEYEKKKLLANINKEQ